MEFMFADYFLEGFFRALLIHHLQAPDYKTLLDMTCYHICGTDFEHFGSPLDGPMIADSVREKLDMFNAGDYSFLNHGGSKEKRGGLDDC